MKRICVYCGSSPGDRGDYAAAARELAEELVARNLGLVYGGASVGLMGLVADRVLALGGEAIGVMPEALVRKEVAHNGLTALHVTRSMHERKTLMAELADGFVALPGGIGTLEELSEIWTWAQLGFHRKPCGLVNTAGYYAGLIAFLDHAVAEGFVKTSQREMLLVAARPAELLDRFAIYRPADVPRLIGAAET
jgi:uncharacterized protein (TIGR00730 family)